MSTTTALASEAGTQWRRWIPEATPKNLIAFLITVILVFGEWNYGIAGGYLHIAVTLGTCVATEIVFSLFLLRKFPRLQSSYISGISLTLLLRPQAGLLWPFLIGAALSISSKYVLRYRNRHLWNPSNFGLAALVIIAPDRVALLSHELGNAFGSNVVIWIIGLMVASRARVLHITLTYVTTFTVLAVARGFITGSPLLAELAPLTGPMYQLLAFFMLTDPPTTVSTKRGRILTVASIAVLESVFRLANDFDWPGASIVAPAPPIIALAIIGPIALALSLRQRAAASK